VPPTWRFNFLIEWRFCIHSLCATNSISLLASLDVSCSSSIDNGVISYCMVDNFLLLHIRLILSLFLSFSSSCSSGVRVFADFLGMMMISISMINKTMIIKTLRGLLQQNPKLEKEVQQLLTIPNNENGRQFLYTHMYTCDDS